RLRPGERLPPSRLMAAQLAVSRTTIVLVYEQLVVEGYAEARQGAGTFVSRQIPDEALVAARRPQLIPSKDGHPDAANDSDENGRDQTGGQPHRQLSVWGGRMAEVHVQVWGGDGRVAERYGPLAFDFRPGRPDWDTFPRNIWGRLTARQVRERFE